MGAATPVEVSQALQHWAGQGVVDAMLVATPALSQAVEIPLGMAVVWVNEIEGLDPRGVDQALSDHVPDGGWVFPFDARDRWFAPEMTVAQFVTATDAARAPAQIYSVRPGPTGWALDKVRTARLRPAYAKQSGTIVGPDFGWVRTPVDSRHLGLRVLRLEPPSTQPSHSVVVDWPNWPSWDPQQQVGADVVAASTTPGAASHQRSDARTVMMAPDWMGFGNLLYLLLHAHRDGAKVRSTPTLQGWLTHFPALSDLVIDDQQLDRRHRRVDPMHRTYGAFGVDFSASELDDFIQSRLLASTDFGDLTERTVVNVRRGDYYDDPQTRESYGFDQTAYLRRALALSNPRQVHVVSDDIEWCRHHLDWIAEIAPTTFANATDSPMSNLRDLVTAQGLVLTNSTFSYWGAHLNNTVHSLRGTPNHTQVVAPWFFSRAEAGGRAYQLDPRWQVVPDLPGGWHHALDSPPQS